MDLTPFFVNVGRIASALEQLVVVLDRPREAPAALDLRAIDWGQVRDSLMRETATPALPAPAPVMPEPEPVEPEPAPAPTSPVKETAVETRIRELFASGIASGNAIALRLNAEGITTERGGKFYPMSVLPIMRRLGLPTLSSKKPTKTAPRVVPGVQPFQPRARTATPAQAQPKTDSDLIAEALAKGRVTVCEPCTDSDGFNHLKGNQS